MRFGFGLEKIGLVCLRWPLAALSVVIISALVAVYGLTKLEFDGDPGEIFRANNEVSHATDRQKLAFPSTGEQLVLLIESQTSYSAKQLEIIRGIHLEVQFVEGVTGVTSIFSARERADKDGNSPTIIPADLPEPAQIYPLLQKLYGHKLVGDLLLSKDLTTSLMIIAFKKGDGSFEGTEKSLNEVQAVIDLVSPGSGLEFVQTGPMAIRHDVLKSLNQDVHMLNAIGAIMAALVCFIFFRNIWYVLISAIPPLIAVLWILGSFGLTGQPVTAMNNVLPTLVLVIAFCDALHMMQSIRRQVDMGGDVRQAVRKAIIDVGPACAMTSLTTMVACSSLMLSSSNAVRDFGASGAVSVFFAFIAVITMVPILSVLILKTKEPEDIKPKDWFNRQLDHVSNMTWRLVENHNGKIVLVSLVALVITTFAYFNTETNYDYRNYLGKASPANHAIDKIDKKFGGADIFNILVETDTPSKQPPKAMVEAHRLIEKLDGVRAVFSYVSAQDWAGGKEKLDDVIDQLPPGFKRNIVSADNKTWLMTVYIPNRTAAETRGMLDVINKAIDPIRAQYPNIKMEISGGIARSAYSSPLVIGGLKFSLGVAVVITILMVGIFVRSFRFALLSAVPNLLPLTLVAGGLYFSGNTFSLIAVLALTIAFGIAIDNTIHVVNRLQIEREKLDMREALSVSIQKVAPVLVAATMLLASGIAVTRFSRLPSIQEFGMYMTIILVLALFASIIVLPAMILMTERFKRGGEK